MAKRYLTIDTFNGGLVTNSDPANLGGVASKVLKNFRIDKHGTLVSRKRRDHIKSIDRGIVYIHNFIDVTNNDNNCLLNFHNVFSVLVFSFFRYMSSGFICGTKSWIV